MNKSCFVLTLCASLLASCGDGAKASSSSFSAATYFAAFDVASKASLAKDNISFNLRTSAFSLHFARPNEEEPQTFDVAFNPLILDARFGGLHQEHVDDVTISLLGENSSGNKGYLSVSGENLPKALDAMGGFTCAPALYLQQGTCYLNLSDAAGIRTAVNTILREGESEYPQLAMRNKISLSEQRKADLDEHFPLDAKFTEAVDTLRKGLEDAYAATPKAFEFEESNGVRTLRFHSTSWNDFRVVADALNLDLDIPTDSSLSLPEYSSVLDEAEAHATLSKCFVELVYEDRGLLSSSFDVAFTFDDKVEGDFIPTGDWAFKGNVSIADLAPLTLNDRNKALYAEYVLPE